MCVCAGGGGGTIFPGAVLWGGAIFWVGVQFSGGGGSSFPRTVKWGLKIHTNGYGLLSYMAAMLLDGKNT